MNLEILPAGGREANTQRQLSLAVIVLVMIAVAPVSSQSPGLVALPGLNTSAVEHGPDISDDGRLVVFQSDRPGGVGQGDIYLYDRRAGALAPVPGLNSAAPEGAPTISADGRFIAFSSRRSGAGRSDIYLYDRTRAVLIPLPGLNTGREESFPSISGDGRFIAYRVSPGRDIGLYDRLAEANVALPGVNTRDFEDGPTLSHDGRFLAFFREEASFQSRFLGDFLFERETGVLTRLPEGIRVLDIAPGGNLLLFLQIRLPAVDIALYDRAAARIIELPGLNSPTVENSGQMSADARFIVFVTYRNGLNNPDIMLYDRGP